MIDGKRILFCEDSIVRGTQLGDIIGRVFDHGAREVHMRPACPPLVHGCRFLNSSRSKSELDLAAGRAVEDIEGDATRHLDEYADETSDRYAAMVDRIRQRLGLTTLSYQTLSDMVAAIGLAREQLCTFCRNGESLEEPFTEKSVVPPVSAGSTESACSDGRSACAGSAGAITRVVRCVGQAFDVRGNKA